MPRRADLLAASGLVLLWCVSLLVVGVHGEFPRSDDWTYARTVRTLLETGRFERDAWVWIPLVTHTGLGASFTWLFGFSFETLRWSVLAMGLGGVLAAYALCRELGSSPRPAAVAAASVALNPLWLNLSFSFMTDVPFAALCTASVWLFVRGLRRGGRAPLVGGLVLALLAAGSRQIGLALPAAALAVLLVTRLRGVRAGLLTGGSLALGLAGFALLPNLFGEGDAHTLFTLRHVLRRLEGPYVVTHVVRNGLSSLTYLGIFLLPPALLAWPRRARLPFAASVALAALLTAGLAATGFWRAPGIDVVGNFYLGTITLAGRESLPAAPAALWWSVTFLGLAAGAFAAQRLLVPLVQELPRVRGELLLPLLWTALYLAPLLLVWPFFDRYLVPLLAPLAAALVARAGRAPRPARLAALVVLAVLAGYGLLGTRDAMEHHRARWAMLRALRAEGVAPERIDGGTEFGGWHHYHRDRGRFLQGLGRYFVVDDEYLVSLGGAPPGYERIASRSYRRLLPPRSETVSVYRRLSGPRGPESRPPS